MYQLVQTAQQGWECPKCQRVYSPSTMMCFACPAQTTTSSGTDIPVHVTGDTVAVGVCDHDWNEESTAPTCRKCGTMKPLLTPFSYTVYPLGGPNT